MTTRSFLRLFGLVQRAVLGILVVVGVPAGRRLVGLVVSVTELSEFVVGTSYLARAIWRQVVQAAGVVDLRLKLRTALVDRPQGSFENDLEGCELLVDVILGFVLHLTRPVLRVGKHLIGNPARFTNDLRSRDELFYPGAGLLDELLCLVLALTDDLVAFADDTASALEVFGQHFDRSVDQIHRLIAMDDHRSGQRDRSSIRNKSAKAGEQLLQFLCCRHMTGSSSETPGVSRGQIFEW